MKPRGYATELYNNNQTFLAIVRLCLLLQIKNLVLPPTTLLSPHLPPHHLLPNRPPKPPQQLLPPNINYKLSSPPTSPAPRTRQQSLDPSLWPQPLCGTHPRADIPEPGIHGLKLGFDFAFEETFELGADNALDKGVEEEGEDVVLGLLERVTEMPDVDVHFVDLEERFFARGGGCVGGQFDLCGDTLLVQLAPSAWSTPKS
jgi:hypothetical protein